MKKNDKMFNEFDIDLETADRIAKEYPSLSDSARERMFNMTINKMNITYTANEEDKPKRGSFNVYTKSNDHLI